MSRIERALVMLALLPAAWAAATPMGTQVVVPAPDDVRARWAAMSPMQQHELRARYQAWRALPEAERQRVRQAAAGVAVLPAAEQAALRERFHGMDRLHRDGWQLGPTLGARYPDLQPLFGYLPPEQREPVLALLRQLDVGQLEQLGVLSRRTPPQDRQALREELLALPAAERGGWLRRKVGGG